MITDVLQDKTVFIDSARGKVEFTNGMYGLSEIYLEHGLGMKLVKDDFDPRLNLEYRFTSSKAQVAFVSALPYLYNQEELLTSKVLKAKAVVLTSHSADFKVLNEALSRAKFLTMNLNSLSVNEISPLVNLFQQALKNV